MAFMGVFNPHFQGIWHTAGSRGDPSGPVASWVPSPWWASASGPPGLRCSERMFDEFWMTFWGLWWWDHFLWVFFFFWVVMMMGWLKRCVFKMILRCFFFFRFFVFWRTLPQKLWSCGQGRTLCLISGVRHLIQFDFWVHMFYPEESSTILVDGRSWKIHVSCGWPWWRSFLQEYVGLVKAAPTATVGNKAHLFPHHIPTYCWWYPDHVVGWIFNKKSLLWLDEIQSKLTLNPIISHRLTH